MAGKRDKKQDVPSPALSWLEQLAQEVNVPPAPPGWYTLSEISEKLNRDRCYVQRLMSEKKAEKKHFMARRSDGNMIRLLHYKL